jgi:hypothetical protein
MGSNATGSRSNASSGDGSSNGEASNLDSWKVRARRDGFTGARRQQQR